LEAYWFNFRGYFFAGFGDVAESLVSFAVKVRKGLCPLCSDFLEDIWRD
jgi:hypothetical protein